MARERISARVFQPEPDAPEDSGRVDEDGYEDLVLKFDKEDVVEAIGAVEDGDDVDPGAGPWHA